ncbi:hypothetical protein [Mesonia aestuariivivens]|uniref:DUF3185 family protein n=1 Tax=Mesonia aestuariivivens TaxID=2796128 RepID=A0ABS6W2U6_9FLAO|nr:hypothetical protein [Mesonia aestuariivivens]MBW2962182.1 hypothetical protein [Mesonia aestuariivivens]
MKNTLKVVLLLVGAVLIGYGIYTILFPHISLENGTDKVIAESDSTQSFAMICLGILTLVCGIAFRKR